MNPETWDDYEYELVDDAEAQLKALVTRRSNYVTPNATSTYLLKWNPKNWEWATLTQDVEEVRSRGFFDTRWSCGNSKRIKRGDRAFLLRTGIAPRGIMASGLITDEPHEAAHYNIDRRGDTALYVGVRFHVC